MHKTAAMPSTKSRALKAAGLFVCLFFVFLLLWLPVKNSYGYMIVSVASRLVMLVKDVRVEEITREQDTIQVTFSHIKIKTDLLIDIPVKTSAYTFNMPLTFALVAAIWFFTARRKRAFAEAFLLILTVHLLYVFSLEANELTGILTDRNVETASLPFRAALQFIWGFTDNMVIRFEPFLIGLYTFLRFRA